MQFEDCLLEAAGQLHLSLTARQQEQFALYYRLLTVWNEKINLTAITEPQQVAIKHMIDSLSVWNDSLFAADSSLIDIGSGAGFPGLPLKIMYPQLQVTLLDSLQKRTNFLQEVKNTLELEHLTILHGRAEELAHDSRHREKYDIAVSRAVAALPILAEYDLPFVRPGGIFAAMKGRSYLQEKNDSQKALQLLGGKILQVQEVKLPGLEDKRAIIYVRKEKATPAKYPRRAGTPTKEPLV